MVQRKIQSGIVVEFPDGLTMRELSDEPDVLKAASADQPSPEDPFAHAIAESPEFTSIASFELQGGVSETRLGAMKDDASAEEIVVRTPLGPDESAVIISDADGVLRWEYPMSIEESTSGLGGLAAAAETSRQAVFKSRYKPEVDTDVKPETLGIIGGVLLKPIKKIIVRFVARKAGKTLSTFLERNIAEGPMQLSGGTDSNAASWSHVDSWSHLWNAGDDKPRSILLFVHGTFSSTEGSFGGLSITDAGSAFLANAGERYDAIVGFNHKTLTKPVLQNARELLDALKTLPDSPVTIDFVTFSRGGLVTRYLVESLIPNQDRSFRFRQGVFVGCTNNGTKLADPDNWEDLLDLYSNVVASAGRFASLLGGPNIKAASKLISEAMQGAFSFGCYLASEATRGATRGAGIPGLASMDPGGEDVRVINQRQAGQSGPGAIRYHVVDTDFDHHLFGEHKLKELGLRKRMFIELADRIVDRLFKKAANDLVVDRDSMSSFDVNPSGDWVEDLLRYEANDGVYHTVYFYQPQTATKLSSWLL